MSSSLGAWYTTNGADYSNDFGLGYDACALTLAPLNANAILRGQSDNGTCLTTMDDACVSALQTNTQNYANTLTGSLTGPQLNLTNTTLPTICNDLGSNLIATFPEECSYFFEDPPAALGGALTTWNKNYDTFLSDSCVINSTDGLFHNVLDFSANSSLPIYTNWTRTIYPILTIFMPVANADAPVSLAAAKTQLVCLHIDNINAGSYIPEAAAEPTPIKYRSDGKSLSGGAVAGIVVGAVLGVALVAGAVVWLWRLKKHRSGLNDEHKANDASLNSLYEAPVSGERYELHDNKLEDSNLHDNKYHNELPEKDQMAELGVQGHGQEVELPA